MLENLTTLPAYNRPTLLTKQKLCTSNCLSSLSGSTAQPAKNMISPKQEHDFTETSELVMKIANNDARKQTWQQSKLPLMMLIASHHDKIGNIQKVNCSALNIHAGNCIEDHDSKATACEILKHSRYKIWLWFQSSCPRFRRFSCLRFLTNTIFWNGKNCMMPCKALQFTWHFANMAASMKVWKLSALMSLKEMKPCMSPVSNYMQPDVSRVNIEESNWMEDHDDLVWCHMLKRWCQRRTDSGSEAVLQGPTIQRAALPVANCKKRMLPCIRLNLSWRPANSDAQMKPCILTTVFGIDEATLGQLRLRVYMSIMTKLVTYKKLIVQRWTYMLATVLKITIQKLLHVKFLNILATRSDSDSKALVRGSDASAVCGSWRTPFFEMARIAWCRAKRCNSHDTLRTWLHRWKSESSPHWCRWKKWNHVCLQYRTICNQMFQGWT